jgi:hypothetical protein
MEPSEIAEFSNEMKEAGEHSLTHVSLIISVLAVLVAMVTVLGHREHTEAVLQQARASDSWNEYQAHKNRAEQLTLATDLFLLQPSSDGAAVQAKLESYKTQLEHLTANTEKESEAAKGFEEKVEIAEHKAAKFDLGEALLQIAVVLASITLLTKQTRYVFVALALGAAGLITAALAFVIH